MNFIGKVVEYLPAKTSGRWTIHTIVFEEENDKGFTNTIAAQLYEDAEKQKPYMPPVGARVNVSFNISSHRYEDKYYTNIKIWNIKNMEQSQSNGYAPQNNNTNVQVPNNDFERPVQQRDSEPPVQSATNDDVDLPF